MAIYTPKGLKVRLPVNWAFALIARLHPHSNALQVLRLTEAFAIVGSVATFLSGLVLFNLQFEPLQIGLCVFGVYFAVSLAHTIGLLVPPFTWLVSISRLYNRVSRFGSLLILLLAFGYFMTGWQGVAAFILGRLSAALVANVIDFYDAKHNFKSSGWVCTSSERSFFHAYSLEASRLGVTTDVNISEDELVEENWEAAFRDLTSDCPSLANHIKLSELSRIELSEFRRPTSG